MPSSSPEDEAALKEHIANRARSFDAPALLALLRASFPKLAVRFTSFASRATQGTIVHEVRFEDDHILVTLNLGLHAVSGPLPGYFVELFADERVGPALADLLAIADHRILEDRIAALEPEPHPRLFPRGPLREDALMLARPSSPMTAHWVFSAVYPELSVTVRRAMVRRSLPAEELRLGTATLGFAAFGDEAAVKVPGLEAVLCTEDTTALSNAPWINEARRRLRDHVFPALARSAAHLRVILVDLEGAGSLALRAPAQLGFDPLQNERKPKVSLIFEGRVPLPSPASGRGAGG